MISYFPLSIPLYFLSLWALEPASLHRVVLEGGPTGRHEPSHSPTLLLEGGAFCYCLTPSLCHTGVWANDSLQGWGLFANTLLDQVAFWTLGTICSY